MRFQKCVNMCVRYSGFHQLLGGEVGDGCSRRIHLRQASGTLHHHCHWHCPARQRWNKKIFIPFLIFKHICRKNWKFQLGRHWDRLDEDCTLLLFRSVCLQWLELSQLCHPWDEGPCQWLAQGHRHLHCPGHCCVHSHQHCLPTQLAVFQRFWHQKLWLL